MDIKSTVLNVIDRALASPQNKASSKPARVDPYRSLGSDDDRAFAAAAGERKKQAENDRLDAVHRSRAPVEFSLTKLARRIAGEKGLPLPECRDIEPPAAAISGRLLAGAAREAGAELLPAAHLKLLVEIEARWQALHKEIRACLPNGEIEARMVEADAKLVGTPGFRGLDRITVRQLQCQRRHALQRQQDQVFEEARPLLTKFLTAMIEGINSHLLNTITAEVVTASERGVPYQPSPYSASLIRGLESLATVVFVNSDRAPLDHLFGAPRIVAETVKGK